MSDTFEQKIRQADLEFNRDEPMVVKLGDLVELLNGKERYEALVSRWEHNFLKISKQYDDLLAQALQEKPCKCSKYIDLRT